MAYSCSDAVSDLSGLFPAIIAEHEELEDQMPRIIAEIKALQARLAVKRWILADVEGIQVIQANDAHPDRRQFSDARAVAWCYAEAAAGDQEAKAALAAHGSTGIATGLLYELRVFDGAESARKYRHTRGTGGWIFVAEASAMAILFPPHMTPLAIFRHPMTKGMSGDLIGSA